MSLASDEQSDPDIPSECFKDLRASENKAHGLLSRDAVHQNILEIQKFQSFTSTNWYSHLCTEVLFCPEEKDEPNSFSWQGEKFCRVTVKGSSGITEEA